MVYNIACISTLPANWNSLLKQKYFLHKNRVLTVPRTTEICVQIWNTACLTYSDGVIANPVACRRTSTISRKPPTDKPDHKQTSRKDKQTSREHVPNTSWQDWLGRDPESGSTSHYINPRLLWYAIYFTLQRWQEHIKSNW